MKAITKLAVWVVMLFLFACDGGSGSGLVVVPPVPPVVDPVDPVFSAGSFTETSTEIDNPYFPLTPGMTYIFEGGTERVEVSVSHDTRTVVGIETVVVLDRAFDEGELVEETFDWYAQDTNGNVWYMGEDSKEIEDGEIISTDGSWEAGQDIDATGANAVAGIQMKVAPFTVGDTYLQEFYATVAEDTAEIVALDVATTVGNVLLPEDGMQSMFTTLQTLERNPLADDPVSTEEFKYFAPGFGLVLETDTSGMERVELVEVLNDRLPDIDPQNFSNSTVIDNKYFPLVPGATYRFETIVGEDEELIIVEVFPDTRLVLGIDSVVVRDRVYIDGDENTGLLLEDTEDWYAQDDDGNVWYMGEFVLNFDEDTGAFLNNDGSWEAGVDGAVPGIQMKADPRTGDSYRQEYLEGSAEDLAAIVDSDVEVMLEDGTTYSTFKIKEWNPLEEDSTEFKYYAAGVGFLREEKLDEAGEVVEAIELTSVETSETFEKLALSVENNEAEEEAQVIVSGSVEPVFLKSLSCFAPNGATLVDLEVAGRRRVTRVR